MLKFLGIITIGFYSISSFAQRAEIDRIQAHHDKILALIKQCNAQAEPTRDRDRNKGEEESEDPCTFLNTKMVLNAQEKPWPSLPKYKKVIDFWYLDNPKNCKECKDQGVSSLQAATIIEVLDEMELKREFIFNNGVLEFAFVQTKSVDKTKYESYYYNEEGTLIRYAEGTNISDAPDAYSPNEPLIFGEASNLQTVFLKSFN